MTHNINEFRHQIQYIDRQIVRLLCQRIKLAIKIGKQKMKLGHPISNPQREKQVLEYVSNLPHAPLQNQDLIDLFQKIMTICRMAQENGE